MTIIVITLKSKKCGKNMKTNSSIKYVHRNILFEFYCSQISQRLFELTILFFIQ